MKVKKSYIETLYLTLKGTEGVLNLSEARQRDSVMKSLEEELKTFYKDRNVVYEKFCFKAEDGTPEIKDNQYSFSPEVIKELNEELVVLGNEEIKVEGLVKSIIEKSEYKPKLGEVEIIDKLIELCEN